jgi:EAL domain-containing protein (putative c-di-GMP-specific phosphodiesterase class I)/GGDEF domain-containing protein
MPQAAVNPLAVIFRFTALISQNRMLSVRSFSLFILSLLLSCSVYAGKEELYPTDTLYVFFLGVCLPVILFFCWQLFRRFTSKTSPLTTEHKITKEELFNYTHDLATNLPTAQHALKQFERALKKTNKASMAAVVFKPINFQQVNTVLGHHNSDILLLQLAFCLKKSVTDNKSLLSFDHIPEAVRLARLQGLDFLVVFDLASTKHDAKSVLDNLCQHLAKAVPEAMSFKSFSLNFELAFGIAISGEHGNSVNEIVAHATDALLKGEANKQMIQYFDNSSVLYTEQQLLLMERLRQDILAENLSWYLQPQINVDDKSIVGFELKVHWHSKDAKPLELPDFIELAEHSGEVYLLTKQMIIQAFKTLFTLHKLDVKQPVSVSLSSKNLLEPELVDFIEQQMKSYNISGKYLVIELSEQVMLSACQRAKNTIDQLKSLDVTIAITNFSGSYESLRYLRKMAIHQVKINCQQLVTDEDNRADKAIINALITLARSMKLPLIGTHIDRNETVNSYIAMGGSLVQGRIIHQGFVLDELELWLKGWFTQHPEAKGFK